MSRRRRYTRNLGRTLWEPGVPHLPFAWIRFEHNCEGYGIFSYANDAIADAPRAAEKEARALLAWFHEQLEAPDVWRDERFWFRATALDHIARARRLAMLLGACGVPIVERRACRVRGVVTWQDRHQIAVRPPRP